MSTEVLFICPKSQHLLKT